MRAIRLAAVLWACAGAALAQTAEQRLEILRIEQVGRELHEHDQAAWRGTDLALEALPADRRATMRGWLTERQGDAVLVVFATGEGDQAVSLYRALYRNGEVVEHGVSDLPLTAAQARLLRARDIAVRAPITPCAPSYNTVTLPRAQEGADGVDVDVYLMPGETDPRTVVVGGYYRVGVDVDAAVAVETQAFSRSCLVLPVEPNAGALFFSHIVTDMPTETHVFLNLTRGLPLFVLTSGSTWSIVNGRVSLERTN